MLSTSLSHVLLTGLPRVAEYGVTGLASAEPLPLVGEEVKLAVLTMRAIWDVDPLLSDPEPRHKPYGPLGLTLCRKRGRVFRDSRHLSMPERAGLGAFDVSKYSLECV